MEMTSEQAKELFVEFIIECIYKGTIRSVNRVLEEGLNWKKPPEDMVALHEWFCSLSEEERKHAYKLVEYSVDSSVFGLLCLFDRVMCGYPIKEKLSDFSIYLQTYRDGADQDTNEYEMQVIVNPFVGEELHDIYGDEIRKLKS